MSGPQLFDFISFATVDLGPPPAAPRVMDGPTKDVAQSHHHLQALFAARWLRVRPRPTGRAGPSCMALASGPTGHPAGYKFQRKCSLHHPYLAIPSFPTRFQNPARRTGHVPPCTNSERSGHALLCSLVHPFVPREGQTSPYPHHPIQARLQVEYHHIQTPRTIHRRIRYAWDDTWLWSSPCRTGFL